MKLTLNSLPRHRAAPSPYKTLGVAKGASDDEIKAAYRSAALAWHPDKRPEQREEAEAKFKEITAAYQAIKDKAPGDAVETRSHGSTLIHVVLEERPHPVFRRVGEDLHVTKWIQRWSKPTERGPGLGRQALRALRFLDEGSGEAVVFRARGKRTHFKSGVRLRKREEGLYADGLSGRPRRHGKALSARTSAAILAARASPFVGVVLALRNVTRSPSRRRRPRTSRRSTGRGAPRPREPRDVGRLLHNMQEFARRRPHNGA
ncbi:DnaJ heat shock protein B2 [Aureococcus anophagefferens]|uniref:DnaJ heat shock protein B2 n=1 Tax=Aureococcus anophagefferens TaxID=44056 RepID=A0ABR1G1R8_AURAN